MYALSALVSVNELIKPYVYSYYLENYFMHCVQLGQILLCVAVMVVKVDGRSGGVTGLRYDRSERPGHLVEQVRPHDHILDQVASGLRSSHGHDAPLELNPPAVLALELSYPGSTEGGCNVARLVQRAAASVAGLAGNLDQSGNTAWMCIG